MEIFSINKKKQKKMFVTKKNKCKDEKKQERKLRKKLVIDS